jgi:PASTA domain
MSDERDEAPRSSPAADSGRTDGDPPADDATRVSARAPVDDPALDDTLPGNSRLDDTLPGTDSLDDLAESQPATTPLPPVGSARTGQPKNVAPRRADPTAIMPPAADDWASEDWASSRANPAWSGRAEVRPPRAQPYTETEWDAGVERAPSGRWYMPIVVGVVLLVLLAVLGWAIYLIAQNSGGNSPTPAATTSAATAPATEPATTSPSAETTTTPPTTEPTATEITVPALRGMSVQEATYALSRKGLKYRLIYVEDAAPPGTVIDSDPAEGQEVPPDTAITLVIAKESSTTPPTPTTPATTTPTTEPTDGPGNDGN